MTYQEQFNELSDEVDRVADKVHHHDPDKIADWLRSIAHDIKQTATLQAEAIDNERREGKNAK